MDFLSSETYPIAYGIIAVIIYLIFYFLDIIGVWTSDRSGLVSPIRRIIIFFIIGFLIGSAVEKLENDGTCHADERVIIDCLPRVFMNGK
jgi:hypothetical protein